METGVAIDGYCERLGPELWAEPLNALTNAGFLLAALLLWPRTRGLPVARLMVANLAVIGLGSALFHTLASRWAAMADTLPIMTFILIYLFAASRDFLGLTALWAGAAALGAFALATATVPLFARLDFLGSSAGYAPIPVLLLAYAWLARRPATRHDLAFGAMLLAISLGFRTLDGPLCPTLPQGTHFIWHLLNALLLAHLILTWRRHRLAARPASP